MKDNVVQLTAILILILIVFTYAKYNSLEQESTRKSIETIATNIELVPAMLKSFDTRFERYARKMGELEGKLAASEEQKRQLTAQVAELSSEVRELKQQQVALRTIEVKKKSR